MTDDHVLVVCKHCGAMRSSKWPKCFCGETQTKPAPPPTPTPEDRLFAREGSPSPTTGLT